MKRQQIYQKIAFWGLRLSTLTIISVLGLIIWFLGKEGVSALSWEFLTQPPKNGMTEGGIFPALVGTLCLTLGAIIFALPLGVFAAIYLTEYAKQGRVVRIIRLGINNLAGVPSVVFGLFGLAMFVEYLRFGPSILSGSLTLGILILPTIIRASEEALKSVPQNLREGSYAVGATKWQTIRRVVLPPALPGIITGGVLGLGRAAGETAPIMFTAVVFMGAGVPTTIFDPIQALPYHLLELTKYIGAYPVEQNAWATAFLLLAIVLGINAMAIIIRERYRVEF